VPFLPSLGAEDKVGDVLGRFNTGTARPLIEYHEALLRGESPLSVAERELIAAFVSATNACAYCEGAHTAAAAQFGVEPELVRQLIDDLGGAPIAEGMRPVLAFARKLTQTPSRVRQSDVDAVRAAGWSERAVYDIVQVTALFNFMNRFVEGLGLNAIPEHFAGTGERLANGYAPMIEAFGLR
jgi:uncharacterized peroxidase-related enzyme